jgi:DNA polymerase III alpha subunit
MNEGLHKMEGSMRPLDEFYAVTLNNASKQDVFSVFNDPPDSHGVEVRPVSVNHSEWDCTLELRPDGALALRLGLRQIKGMREEDAGWIATARGNG